MSERVSEWVSEWVSARALPSAVHAAKVVLDQGVQATSPTWVLRSKESSGSLRVCSQSLTVQSAEHERKIFGLKQFQRTCNRMCSRLQPYVLEAATVCARGCNRMYSRLQPYGIGGEAVPAHRVHLSLIHI